jgi:cephalosporin hydroxylase
MTPERSVLRHPKKAIADCVVACDGGHRWLDALQSIVHEKDRDRGMYKTDRTYPTYYEIGRLLRPSSLFEVGVRFGYSLASLCCGAELKTRVFGIDMESYEKDSNAYAGNALKSLGVEAKLFSGSSRGFDVVGRTGLSTFDLIHIDGDHTMAGALQDLLYYSQFSDRLLIDDVLDSRVWGAVKAFVALQEMPVSQTYFRTGPGLMLIER